MAKGKKSAKKGVKKVLVKKEEPPKEPETTEKIPARKVVKFR